MTGVANAKVLINQLCSWNKILISEKQQISANMSNAAYFGKKMATAAAVLFPTAFYLAGDKSNAAVAALAGAGALAGLAMASYFTNRKIDEIESNSFFSQTFLDAISGGANEEDFKKLNEALSTHKELTKTLKKKYSKHSDEMTTVEKTRFLFLETAKALAESYQWDYEKHADMEEEFSKHWENANSLYLELYGKSIYPIQMKPIHSDGEGKSEEEMRAEMEARLGKAQKKKLKSADKEKEKESAQQDPSVLMGFMTGHFSEMKELMQGFANNIASKSLLDTEAMARRMRALDKSTTGANAIMKEVLRQLSEDTDGEEDEVGSDTGSVEHYPSEKNKEGVARSEDHSVDKPSEKEKEKTKTRKGEDQESDSESEDVSDTDSVKHHPLSEENDDGKLPPLEEYDREQEGGALQQKVGEGKSTEIESSGEQDDEIRKATEIDGREETKETEEGEVASEQKEKEVRSSDEGEMVDVDEAIAVETPGQTDGDSPEGEGPNDGNSQS